MQDIHLSIYTKISGRIIRFVGRLMKHFREAIMTKLWKNVAETLSKSKRIFDCIESIESIESVPCPALDPEMKNELKTSTAFCR
jgi:hypothetical protein